jgi:hypothetical protein
MMRRRPIVLALLVACAAVPVVIAAQQPQPFPHERHAALFPTCVGCHAGVPAGDAAATFPSPAACAQCHDGVIQKRVSWTPPAPRGLGLLTFSHPAHLARAKDVTCTSCHAAPRDSAWMHVGKASPDGCVGCHAHSAPAHLDDANRCTTCHRPLAEATGLGDARVAALPKPVSHGRPDFLAAHGAAARANGMQCATCHARESCARCHVDATRSPVIQALASDARVARVVAGRAPTYPVPATHGAADFGVAHGPLAMATGANCATCHARSSCATCHTGTGAAAVLRDMPAGGDGSAPGVQLKRAIEPGRPGVPAAAASVVAAAWIPQAHAADSTPRRVRVHQPGFISAHATAAASGELQCASCHAQSFCTKCHAGEKAARGYHPANFVSTHAPQAYARDVDCSSCHNPQAFCRSCHIQSGLAPRSATQRSATFHNAQPLWLLLHGRAARQDLPSCTTCHQQTYCMQCHSQLGARINPHGPGFDAEKMASRNGRICLACHFTNPLNK